MSLYASTLIYLLLLFYEIVFDGVVIYEQNTGQKWA